MDVLKKLAVHIFGGKTIRRFMRHRAARTGGIVLLSEAFFLIVLPLVANLDPYEFHVDAINHAPNAQFLFGTDELGRDMFARVIYGGRVSLFIGIASNVVGLVIGLPLGLLAGYYRGFCEMLVMRATEVFMSVPSMIFTIVLAALFQPTIPVIIVIIGVFFWTGYARIIYTNVLSVRSREYVEAARTIGSKNGVIMFRDILPNVIAPVWIVFSGSIAQAILMEATLSYIGVGIKAPQPSLGSIIYSAQSLVVMTQRIWIWIPAGALLIITVIAANLLGDGIRDVLDPNYTI
ncbi:MAG: ABC transporter permease [Oscillospiraceae bacterium]|jgi:peptide/nickel transport system permease protein|nr:ABC transporter permease [Oscillospiraceae bacterium]